MRPRYLIIWKPSGVVIGAKWTRWGAERFCKRHFWFYTYRYEPWA